MKNVVVTVIVGFITGLIISGVLFDVITLIGKSFTRVQIAWSISKAEKAFAQERFSDSINIYENVLNKIDQSNKILVAKTKNNFALCKFELLKQNFNNEKQDFDTLDQILDLLSQAKSIYDEENNKSASQEVLKNIEILKNYKKI